MSTFDFDAVVEQYHLAQVQNHATFSGMAR
jgi:hypothetical protein